MKVYKVSLWNDKDEVFDTQIVEALDKYDAKNKGLQYAKLNNIKYKMITTRDCRRVVKGSPEPKKKYEYPDRERVYVNLRYDIKYFEKLSSLSRELEMPMTKMLKDFINTQVLYYESRKRNGYKLK